MRKFNRKWASTFIPRTTILASPNETLKMAVLCSICAGPFIPRTAILVSPKRHWRWPFNAANAHVCASHSQSLLRPHFKHSRCPPITACLQINLPINAWGHSGRMVMRLVIHSRHSMFPCSAAYAYVNLSQGQSLLINHLTHSMCPFRDAALQTETLNGQKKRHSVRFHDHYNKQIQLWLCQYCKSSEGDTTMNDNLWPA